jgi:hypothetical protein
MTISARSFHWLLVTIVVAAVTGCGAQTGDISGTVSLEGQKLPSGRIVFLCEGGDKPVLMSSIRDGFYSVNEAPIGSARVTVETFEITTTRVPNMISSPTPPDQQEEGAVGAAYMKIPARYKARTTSGLTHDVVSGNQSRDFDLTP